MITTFNSDNLRDRRPAEDAIIEMHIAINAKVKEYSMGVKPYTFEKQTGKLLNMKRNRPLQRIKRKLLT